MQENYDIIVATETWLRYGVGDSELVDPDLYNIVRCGRDYEALNKGKGGAVLFLSKTKYKILNCKSLNSKFEVLVVTLDTIR